MARQLREDIALAILYPDHHPEDQVDIAVLRLIEGAGVEGRAGQRPVGHRAFGARRVKPWKGPEHGLPDQKAVPHRSGILVDLRVDLRAGRHVGEAEVVGAGLELQGIPRRRPAQLRPGAGGVCRRDKEPLSECPCMSAAAKDICMGVPSALGTASPGSGDTRVTAKLCAGSTLKILTYTFVPQSDARRASWRLGSRCVAGGGLGFGCMRSKFPTAISNVQAWPFPVIWVCGPTVGLRFASKLRMRKALILRP
jgi:hypothetical protein